MRLYFLDEHVPALPGEDGQVAIEQVQHGLGFIFQRKGVTFSNDHLKFSSLNPPSRKMQTYMPGGTKGDVQRGFYLENIGVIVDN